MNWILFRLLRLPKMPIVFTRTGGYGITRCTVGVEGGNDYTTAVAHHWVFFFGRREWRISPRFAADPDFLHKHLSHS